MLPTLIAHFWRWDSLSRGRHPRAGARRVSVLQLCLDSLKPAWTYLAKFVRPHVNLGGISFLEYMWWQFFITALYWFPHFRPYCIFRGNLLGALSVGVLRRADEEGGGVPLPGFSRAVALVPAWAVSETKNWCDGWQQLALLAINVFGFQFCSSLPNDQYALLRRTLSQAAGDVTGKSVWKKRRGRTTG